MKPKKIITFLLLISVYFSIALSADDSEFITVVDEKNLDGYWQIKRKVRAVVEKAKRSKGGCSSIAFIIEPDGKTSNVSIVASIPDDALDNVWLDKVRRTRYKPAKDNMARLPVYTVISRASYNPAGGSKEQQAQERSLMEKINIICGQNTAEYLAQIMKESKN